MSHAYVVRPKVDKSGETEKIRYYGVPVTSGQVSTEQLARPEVKDMKTRKTARLIA